MVIAIQNSILFLNLCHIFLRVLLWLIALFRHKYRPFRLTRRWKCCSWSRIWSWRYSFTISRRKLQLRGMGYYILIAISCGCVLRADYSLTRCLRPINLFYIQFLHVLVLLLLLFMLFLSAVICGTTAAHWINWITTTSNFCHFCDFYSSW